MTLHEICGIAAGNAAAAGIALDGVKLEELALKLNDDKVVKAAVWLKQVIKPELLPEFDPHDVDEERYVLICVGGGEDDILFYRSYPSRQEAHEEMTKQYEYAKVEDCNVFGCKIDAKGAWLGCGAHTMFNGSISWWILPADQICNKFYGYEPIQ